jgi:hypothetical protein
MLTKEELEAEYNYILKERLGIMCGKDNPTAAQLARAKQEANWAVEQMKEAEANKLVVDY